MSSTDTYIPKKDDTAFYSLFEGRTHLGAIVPHAAHYDPDDPTGNGNKFRLSDPVSGLGRIFKMPDGTTPALVCWPCSETYFDQPSEVMAKNRVSVDKAGMSQNSIYGVGVCTIDGKVPLGSTSTYYEAPASPFLPDVLEIQNQWIHFKRGLRVSASATERGVFVSVKATTFGGTVALNSDGTVDRSISPLPLAYNTTKVTEDMIPDLRKRAEENPTFALHIDDEGELACGKYKLKVGRRYPSLPADREGWIPLVNMRHSFMAEHGKILEFESGETITLPTLEEVNATEEKKIRIGRKIDGWSVFRPCWTADLRKQMHIGHMEGIPQKTAAVDPIINAGDWFGHNGDRLYRHHTVPLQDFVPPLGDLRAIKGITDLTHYKELDTVDILEMTRDILYSAADHASTLEEAYDLMYDLGDDIDGVLMDLADDEDDVDVWVDPLD